MVDVHLRGVGGEWEASPLGVLLRATLVDLEGLRAQVELTGLDLKNKMVELKIHRVNRPCSPKISIVKVGLVVGEG